MSKLFRKSDFPVQWIPVNELGIVWPEAQRHVVEQTVRDIIEDFDPSALGTIEAAVKNGAGIYHVIDGQNRTAALKRMGYGDELVQVRVHLDVHTAEQAARRFKLLNHFRKPSAIAGFGIAVVAGYSAESEVERIAAEAGYRIVQSPDAGTIAAVTTLMSIYRRRGPAVLRDALTTIRATFGDDRDAVHKMILHGYSDLLHSHGDIIDRARLIDRVGKNYTPLKLQGAAKTLRQMYGGLIGDAVARVLANAYNSGLRGGKLQKIELGI